MVSGTSGIWAREYFNADLLDPERAAAFDLTPSDIIGAIRAQNTQWPVARSRSRQSPASHSSRT